MNKLLKNCTSSRFTFALVLTLGTIGSSLLCTTTVWAASSWKDSVAAVYYVYTKGSSVIANKSALPYSPTWVQEGFTPQVTTNGSGCDSGNKVTAHAFDSYISFTNCAGLSIQEESTPAANKAWFKDVNMSYIVGDFDNGEKIDIGRGSIVASGRSAVGTPRGQTATAEKDAKDTTGSDKYDCDTPNPNPTKNCSLLIYFTQGNPGGWHITLDDNGYKPSIHEFWYDGPVTKPYHTLTFHPNGGNVVENDADPNVLVRHNVGIDVLREYDAVDNAINFPEPTRSGYTFRGWSTISSGDCLVSKNCVTSKSMSKDEDLYAHWQSNPPASKWTIIGRTSVSSSTAAPGQQVTFTHYVKNNGPDATTTSVWSDTNVSVVGVGVAKAGRDRGTFTAGQEKPVLGSEQLTDKDTITIPSNATNDTQYCERVGFAPYAWNAPANTPANPKANYRNGEWACVTVQYSYELTPHVDVDAPMVRAGDDVTFKPNVTDDNSYPTKDTTWSVRRVIIPPALSVPYTGVRTNGNFDCPYYTSKGMGCTDVESGNRVFSSVSATYLANVNGYTYNVASSVPYGTQICYALAINSRDNTPNQKAEALTCVIVTKSPHLQVWGNDTRVGSTLLAGNNKLSLIKTNTGSWGEYGVLAPGSITTFGSASNKASALLTFANKNPAALGHYLGAAGQASSLGNIPDIGAYLQVAGANTARTGVSLSEGTTDVSAYQANTVVHTNGTVLISNDIKNDSKNSTLTQMVIIANNINISPNVTQVDAWLIAPGGTINTCVMGGDQRLTATTCDKQLHINGPITASSLLLRRTFDGDGTEPAEILNLRGDAYIWMRRISEQMGTIHTTYLRELPPRY